MQKASVILWDAGIRDNNGVQTSDRALVSLSHLPTHERRMFDVHFVEFYGEPSPGVRDFFLRPDGAPEGFHCHTMLRDPSEPWHIGKLVNEGVRSCAGDVIVILDADCFITVGLIEEAVDYLEAQDIDAVVNTVRYDQPEAMVPANDLDLVLCDAAAGANSPVRRTWKIANPTNYGAFVAVRRDTFVMFGGYTEADAFIKDSAVAWEFMSRLLANQVNRHFIIDRPLYHPWHPNTGATAPGDRMAVQFQTIGTNFISKRVQPAGGGYGTFKDWRRNPVR